MLYIAIGKLDSNSDLSHSHSKRSRRHNSATQENPSSGQDDHNESKGNIYGEYMKKLRSHEDPPYLWKSTPEDTFPDPRVDLEGFMAYCGKGIDQVTAALWLVTREMVEAGVEIKPLATHKPFLFSMLSY